MIKINNKDCTSAIKGTGIGPCLILIGYLSKILLFEKGFKFDSVNDTIDDAFIEDLIQQGKIVVLPTHDSFEDQSEEDVFETLPNGVQQFVRYGIKKFAFNFSNGICFGNALATLSGKKWEVAFVDNDGQLVVTQSGLQIKGFSTAFVRKGAMQLNDGSTSTKDTLIIGFDMTGTKQMNEDIAVILPKDSIAWNNLNGIVEVRLVTENLVASDLQIGLIDGCSATPIGGLDDPIYWRFEAPDGTVTVPSAVTYSNGIYTFTGISAGTYEIKLYDAVNNVSVIVDSVDTFYKSAPEVVVIA